MFNNRRFNISRWRKRFKEFDYPAAALYVQNIPPKYKSSAYNMVSSIARQYVPQYVYKFSSIKDETDLANKLSTLEKGCIYLSNPNILNDPFDCRCGYYDYEKSNLRPSFQTAVEKLMQEIPGMCFVSSFTECNEQSFPMWAHYANDHHGYCVSYDILCDGCELFRKFLYPVQYTDTRFNLNHIIDEQISLAVKRQLQPERLPLAGVEAEPLALILLLLTNMKHISWSYEKEHRFSVSSTFKGLPEVPAKPNAIYIGYKCNEGNSQALLSTGTKLNIPVYKMIRSARTTSFGLTTQRFA